jgi:hypothetical protein
MDTQYYKLKKHMIRPMELPTSLLSQLSFQATGGGLILEQFLPLENIALQKPFNRGGNKGLKGKFVNRATKHSSPMETTASQQSLVTQTCEFVEDERRSAAHPSTFTIDSQHFSIFGIMFPGGVKRNSSLFSKMASDAGGCARDCDAMADATAIAIVTRRKVEIREEVVIVELCLCGRNFGDGFGKCSMQDHIYICTSAKGFALCFAKLVHHGIVHF